MEATVRLPPPRGPETRGPMTAVQTAVATTRLFGVIRASDPEEAVWAALAARQGGLELVEVTMTTPGACEAIAELAARGILVGVGTVLDTADAERAIAAGARFVVSPHADEGIVRLCREAGVWVSQGGSTPTELLAIHRMGADCVKVFPAEALGGPRFIKLVRDPLPFLKLMPTGGVDGTNLQAYLAAGVTAVGVATCLFDKQAIAARDAEAVARKAADLLALSRA